MVSRAKQQRTKLYWLFQAHPKGDDLRDFLSAGEAGKSYSWRIPPYKNPKDHMAAGDGVVLWQAPGKAPEASGVYALATLTGRFPRGQAQFTLDVVRRNGPIPTETLRRDQRLKDLRVIRRKGSEGPCFKVNALQWAAFVDAWGIPTSLNGTTQMLSLPVQVPHVARTEVSGEAFSFESERREARLVLEYARHIRKEGSEVDRKVFFTPERIECDLFDNTRHNLIEAKGSAGRIDIRMAIGQLADYSFHLTDSTRKPSLAVLVPNKPSDDLLKLLDFKQISAVWRGKNGKFQDNAGGRFT